MIKTEPLVSCYHCGDECDSEVIKLSDKNFCCQGCLNVYQLLNENDLDEYYCLNEAPGTKGKDFEREKFAYLEEESVIQKLLLFRNEKQAQVSFYLPQMHCSSCLWLLENLSKINENIYASQVNFNRKTLRVTFDINQLSLRKLVELLAGVGYEPVIDLYENEEAVRKKRSRNAYLKLGITGFCFSNIMLIAFPEYLGLDPSAHPQMALFFKYISVLLSLPVVFYGAQEFFVNAWYSLKQKYLNIDTPIAVAIAVTFLRSLYEVFSNTGTGYFDSMAGIVFFMLLGRTIQNRSYTTLRFNRDYKSYFPIAVTAIKNNIKKLVKLEEIETHDVLQIHHQEVIPTDSLLSKGDAKIDYSFVTGEDRPERIGKSEVIYAGGRNIGGMIEVVAMKPFNQNSFTQLWNNEVFKKSHDRERESRVTLMSKYFSVVVLTLSLGAFIFWQISGQPDIAWKAATTVLIIACPCTLLLTASFTNGYVLQKLAQAGMYLKDATIIESMAKADFLAFDKTGTLTEPNGSEVKPEFSTLDEREKSIVKFICSQSLHPLSRAITEHYKGLRALQSSSSVNEIPGKGLEAEIDGKFFKIGSRSFTNAEGFKDEGETAVYVSVDGEIKAKYGFEIRFIPGTDKILDEFSTEGYELAMISGDNTDSREQLAEIFGGEEKLHYHMKPEDKLAFVKEKQEEGHKVVMVGDGLNDAGALKQSDVGISVVKSAFAFSPSCDAILDISRLKYLPRYMRWAKGTGKLINLGFGYSIIFNIIGLSFALTGKLSPLIAAIIMPLSSWGIILIAYLGVQFMVREPRGEKEKMNVELKRKEYKPAMA